jgi:tRNA(fMet)-specific endonuclease VapC
MRISLIDTDILSELLKRKNASVVKRSAEYLAEHQQFAISAITRYEVMRGLKEKSAWRQLAQFELFCQNSEVYAITHNVLDRASDLWVEARKGGNPGRDPDLVIAATALEHGRVLVTGNVDHFIWMPGLTVENWRDRSGA